MAIAFDPRHQTIVDPARPTVSRGHLTLVPPLPVSAVTYWRRRIVALVLAVVVLVGLAVAVGQTSQIVFADRGGNPATASVVGERVPATLTGLTYVAQPGDTIWSIAERLDGPGSVHDRVEALTRLNGGTRLMAGQFVLLPAP
jgi:hypothetical protein